MRCGLLNEIGFAGALMARDLPDGKLQLIDGHLWLELSHIAFRLRDEAHLRAAYDDLKAHGVKIITAINHGVTKSVYFLDRMAINSRFTATVCPTRSRSSLTLTRGLGKLDFAKDAPDFREAIRSRR
jgi:hypothetical protein